LTGRAQLIQIVAIDLDDERTVRAAHQIIDAINDRLTDADRIPG